MKTGIAIVLGASSFRRLTSPVIAAMAAAIGLMIAGLG
jgi:hypothetical protein